MCLIYDQKGTDVLKHRLEKRGFITVYKEYSFTRKGDAFRVVSPVMGKLATLADDDYVLSNRRSNRLSEKEINARQVNKGIHVHLEKSYWYIPVLAYLEDFVGANNNPKLVSEYNEISYYLYGLCGPQYGPPRPTEAVFTKIKLTDASYAAMEREAKRQNGLNTKCLRGNIRATEQNIRKARAEIARLEKKVGKLLKSSDVYEEELSMLENMETQFIFNER